MSTFAMSKTPLCSYGTTGSGCAMQNYSSTTSQQNYSVNSPHHYWLRSASSVSPGFELQPDAKEGPVVEHAFTTSPDPCHTQQNALGVPSEANRLNCILESFVRDVRGKIPISGQSICRSILKFIAKADREIEYMQFYGVYPDEYTELLRYIDETAYITLKPRLSYIDQYSLLLVEMPTPLHEAPFAGLSKVFSRFFDKIPYDTATINIEILNTVELSAGIAPDQRISFHRVGNRRESTFISTMLGESALSQDAAALFVKLRQAVADNPHLLLIIAVMIKEARPYHSPVWKTVASQTLLRQPLHRNSNAFLVQSDEDGISALNVPVVVCEHEWCSIDSVSFKVWVRGNDPIDIDTNDANLMAEGKLFPDDNMDAVIAMMEKGARALQRELALFAQRINPHVDIHAIDDPSIPIHFDRADLIKKMVAAMEETAFIRYKAWYISKRRSANFAIVEENLTASTPVGAQRQAAPSRGRGHGRGRGRGAASVPLPTRTSKRRK